MSRTLTNFEMMLQLHLNEGVPERKYDLWLHTESGQIVGYYYQSVNVAFQDQGEPGWVYVVEARNGSTNHVYEDCITLIT
ncbi:hypothetical protein [Pantanalinema sp. GBBB05]|uniref:hypothetical protein n=1 Tax=Pantanalinema sp. GBBB05 TaxID=2604139 RepID=UPI001DE55E87|nr:hypothetical protein [Pantanalinema sp. GBBB05]